MSELRRTPVTKNGRKGVYVHDKLCSDGPVDEKTGEPLIDPATGEPYPGPNDDMAELLHEFLLKIRDSTHLQAGGSTHVVPRFGVLSLIAMHTPIFVYDHPAFKKITNTAFTDGVHVFIDADFMRKLYEQELETDGRESGIVFLILHELMHKLYLHVDRLKNFPPRIANIAEDMVINGKLVKGFPMVKPVKLMSEIGYGMKPAEAEKYFSMSEEVVAEALLIEERKKEKKQKQKGGQGQPQQGQGGGQGQSQQGQGQSQKNSNQQGGQGGQGQQDPSQGQGGDQDENGQGNEDTENQKGNGSGDDDEQEEEYSPIHHITPEELLDIIEKEGLSDTVGQALDLPQSDDVEGVGEMKERARLGDTDAVQNAIAQANQCGGQYPGQHIAEEAAEVIGGLEKGKITWKLAIRKHIMGDGQKLRHSDDEADIPWLLDKGTLGTDPFYAGALIPFAPDETVLILVDTSGSTSGGNMRKQFLSESLGLKRNLSNASDTARKVILLSADTVIRGEVLEITDQNVDKLLNEGVPIFGNGGTDFARCLNEALALPLIKKEKIKTTIYFTDCCDAPPRREDYEQHLSKGMKIVFITTPGMYNEKWNQEVSSFAEVYCIEEGTEVNLDKEQINSNTRKNK